MIVRVKYTSPLRMLLDEGGLWLDYSQHKYGFLKTSLQIGRVIYLSIVWVLLIIKVFQEGVQFLLTPSAVFIPLGGVLITATVIVLFSARNLKQLVDNCEYNLSLYQNNWEKEVIKKDSQRLETFLNFANLGLKSFTLLYIFLPLIIDVIRMFLGYEEPYSLPTPLEGYLEQNCTRNAYFYMIIVASDIWFIIGITTTISFEGIIFFMVSYTTTELKILKSCVQKLYPVEDNGALLLPDWDLKVIITYHRHIIRLNHLQKDCITFPYIFQNLSATLSLCFVMFLIRQLMAQNNMMMLFLSVMFIGMLIVLLFVVCFAGEYLQSESEELFGVICSLPWYRQSPKVRRDLLMIMTQAIKPLVLEYKESTLNLTAFMQTMNNSYSYFMLMNSVSPS